jgi:hypothetical protein
MDAWIANMRDDRIKRTSCQETTKAHLEFEEPIAADMKVCQKKTTCHEATETHTEKIQPDPRMMKSVAEHHQSPRKTPQ